MGAFTMGILRLLPFLMLLGEVRVRCPDPPKGFWFNYPWRILSTDGNRFPGNLMFEGETHGFEAT